MSGDGSAKSPAHLDVAAVRLMLASADCRRARGAIGRAMQWRGAEVASAFVGQLRRLPPDMRLTLARVAIRALEPRDRRAVAEWLVVEEGRHG